MKFILRIITVSVLFITLFYCCKTGNMNREEIKKALNSNDQYSIMDAIYWIGKNQDTSFIEDLFKLSYDPRVSHQREFLGMSIHQACIGAFEKITQQASPNKNSYKVDTMNIIFYKRLFNKQ